MLKMIRFGEIIVKNYTFNLGLSRSLNYFFLHFSPKNEECFKNEILREHYKNDMTKFSRSFNYFSLSLEMRNTQNYDIILNHFLFRWVIGRMSKGQIFCQIFNYFSLSPENEKYSK